MNVYRKLAFGVTIVLVLAWLAKDDLVMLIALAATVAVLTLPVTWMLIFSVLQMAGYLVGGVGHGIGWTGDTLTGWSEQQKLKLTARPAKSSSVPAWGSSELQVPRGTDAEELDVPEFVKDDKQRVDDGLDIFEPR